MIECILYVCRLYFNETTGRYSNKQGVKIRVKPPQFGGTECLETLDPNLSSAAYFDTFVKYFEGLGYTKNESIIGAGYDWRHGPGKEIEREREREREGEEIYW